MEFELYCVCTRKLGGGLWRGSGTCSSAFQEDNLDSRIEGCWTYCHQICRDSHWLQLLAIQCARGQDCSVCKKTLSPFLPYPEHSGPAGKWPENGDVVGEAAAAHKMELKLVWNCAVQYGSHWSCVAIQHLKDGCSKLRRAIREYKGKVFTEYQKLSTKEIVKYLNNSFNDLG